MTIRAFARPQAAGTLAALVLLLASGPWPARPHQEAAATPAKMTATVGAVDAKVRRLELVTGVGLALRTIQVKVPKECAIKVGGKPAELRELKRGQLVRARYTKEGTERVAQTIEKVQPGEEGGKQ